MTRTLSASVARVVLSLVACLGAGCHLILDPDQYRLEYDGSPDAPPPDAAPPDVNPALLAIDGVEPDEAFEGQGAFEGGPGVTVVLHGASIAPGATVTLDGVPGATLDHVTIAADGSAIGAVLRLPVDPDHGATAADETLTLTVTQGSPAVTATATITVHMLDELVLMGNVADASMFAPLYSTISTSAAVTLRGAAMARLEATSSIDVAQIVDANGGSATAVGAGGCAGGAANVAGACDPGGGRAGSAASLTSIGAGGGGGGARVKGTDGGPGNSSGGGAGGAAAASAFAEYTVPLVAGTGGGGGATGLVALGINGTVGGKGGAGAGTMALTSQGSLSIAAALSAIGGDGATAGGGCTSGGGGGGGGSGGTLLLRAAGSLTLGAPLRATGGAGGGASGTGCPGNIGGAGSDGFIRVDAPAGAIDGLDAMPSAARGPMWAPDTAQVVNSASVEVTLFGSANHPYGYAVGDGAMQTATPGATGAAKLTLTLEPRVLTSVCAFVSPTLVDQQLTLPEAKTCRVLVYIP